MKRYQFYLPEKVASRLERRAQIAGVSLSEVLRRVLDEYFAEQGS
jgi:Ribbon-helix-helix protein, copG family